MSRRRDQTSQIRARYDFRLSKSAASRAFVVRLAMPPDKEQPEETDNAFHADARNFYKVEKWTQDGTKVDRMPWAGSSLDIARKVFDSAIEHRPRIRLTIRQQPRVLQQWPE
jgi:hypothetical protein